MDCNYFLRPYVAVRQRQHLNRAMDRGSRRQQLSARVEPRLAEIMPARLRSWRDSPRWPAWARSPLVGSRSSWVGCCVAIEPGASPGSLVTGGRRKDRIGFDAARHDVWPTGSSPAHEVWRKPACPLGHDGECPRHRGVCLITGEGPLLSLDPLRRAGRTGPRRSRPTFVDRHLSCASGAARSRPIEGGLS